MVSDLTKKIYRHQLINNDCNTKTLAAISDLHDRVEEVSEEDPDAETIETVREIAGLHLKLRSNTINQEETALMVRNQAADLKQATSVAKTPRTSSTLSFLCFSTSCGGIRSAVPPDLTADIYYQDITPADHNVRGSY